MRQLVWIEFLLEASGLRSRARSAAELCRFHHRELHRVGNERCWWDQVKVDPVPIAFEFWQQTRGLVPVASAGKTPWQTQDRSLGDLNDSRNAG